MEKRKTKHHHLNLLAGMTVGHQHNLLFWTSVTVSVIILTISLHIDYHNTYTTLI